MGDPLARFVQQPDPLADFVKEEPANTEASPKVGGGYGVLSDIGEGYLKGIGDFGKNLAGLATGGVNLLQNPDQIGGAVGSGASAVGEAIQHPFDTVKGIFWDGIIKPVVVNNARLIFDQSLDHESRVDLARESSLAISGLAVGEGVGRVLGMFGKGPAAAKAMKNLARAKGFDQINDALSAGVLSPTEAIQVKALSDQMLADQGWLRSATRAGSIGASSGFAQGVAMSNDPSEAFKQGIVNGMVGAFLGPAFHAVTKGSSKAIETVRATAYEQSRNKMIQELMKANQPATVEDLLNGVDPVRIAARHTPANQVHVLHDVPEGIVQGPLESNVIVHEGKNGLKSYMIFGRDVKVGDQPVKNPSYMDNPAVAGKKVLDDAQMLPDDAIAVIHHELMSKLGEVFNADEMQHPVSQRKIDIPGIQLWLDLARKANAEVAFDQAAQMIWRGDLHYQLAKAGFAGRIYHNTYNKKVVFGEFAGKMKPDGTWEFDGVPQDHVLNEVPLEDLPEYKGVKNPVTYKGTADPQKLLDTGHFYLQQLNALAAEIGDGKDILPTDLQAIGIDHKPANIGQIYGAISDIEDVLAAITDAKEGKGDWETAVHRMMYAKAPYMREWLERAGIDAVVSKGDFGYQMLKPIPKENLFGSAYSDFKMFDADFQYKNDYSHSFPADLVKDFQTTGFIRNQIVEYKGKEYAIKSFETADKNGKALADTYELEDPNTGETVRAKAKSLTKLPGVIKQGKHISYEDAHRISAIDAAAAHFAMKEWLKNVQNEIEWNGMATPETLKEAPVFALNRWQRSGYMGQDWSHITGKTLAMHVRDEAGNILGNPGDVITPEMAAAFGEKSNYDWIETQTRDYDYGGAGEPNYPKKSFIPFPDEIQFSFHRQNTYYTLVDEAGTNDAYSTTTSDVKGTPKNGYIEGGDKQYRVMVALKNPLLLIGNDANAGHTGRAIIAKLKPEWGDYSWQDHLQDIKNYLYPKLKPEEIAFFEHQIGKGEFIGWDRIGSELAKDAGYTEVLNIYDVNRIDSSGNEFVKLEHPDAYKELKYPSVSPTQAMTKYFNKDMPKSVLRDLIAESPEDAAIYHDNIMKHQEDVISQSKEAAENFSTHNLAAERTSDGSIDLRDGAGNLVGNFASVKEAYDYSRSLAGNGGDLIPGDTRIRAVGFDDNGSFALNQKRNLVNALRDWFATRASAFTTPYQYFTTLESKFGRRFFNDFFLPLQHARTAYNGRLSALADRVNPIIARVAAIDPERRAHISNAIETFSPEEILSDRPTILSRALNEDEKRVGQALGQNSTKSDRIAAYQYRRAQKALVEEQSRASKEEAARLEADFNASWQLTPVQQQVVKIFNDVLGEKVDDIALYAVNRLADAIEMKSPTRAEYVAKHNMTGDEIGLVRDITKVYDDLADAFSIEPGRRLGGYITHAVEYDGKVVDGSIITNSRWLSPKTRDFVYAAVRTGEMQDLIRDPGELLKKYVTQGARSEHLYPAITKAKTFIQNALPGLDRGSAEAIYSRSTQYMNQILGIMDPEDALVTADVINRAEGAFVTTLKKLGIDESTTDKWLKKYFKVSELSTQGLKPIAGVRDATSIFMYWYSRFGTKRLASFLSDWNKATDTKGILQEQGKIPGLNVEFFTGVDGALKDQTFLDRAAELGFKFSGQPYVYQQFHAMAYINTIKTVLSAASDLESKKITQKQFEKRIGLSTYDAPQIKQFAKLMREQPSEAAKYLADITGREIVGYYGMANHPFFMRTRAGKVLGQHGQWPLWMLQNFGRLASQGTRGERLLTAAKMAAMYAAVKYGGQAAGFNLGSWTFSPDNAIFLPGFSSPLGNTAFWGSVYMGSNDPSQQEFAGRMLQRAADPTRAQYFLPIPAQAYNILWGFARANNDDPLHIVGGQMLGLPINSEDYPKPQ